MTTLHQLEHAFTFTPDEVKYLMTAQHFAEERSAFWLGQLKEPKEAYRTSAEDVVRFGSTVRQAAAKGETTIPIKMGVVFWLNSVWQPMYQQGYKVGYTEFPKGMTSYQREDIHKMHLQLFKFYIDHANGK